MKNLAIPFAAALLAGCASSDLGRIVQQATETVPAAGGSTGSGSVASGGTGYLPCPTPQAPGTGARPECR
jgi:hypothetical protein